MVSTVIHLYKQTTNKTKRELYLTYFFDYGASRSPWLTKLMTDNINFDLRDELGRRRSLPNAVAFVVACFCFVVVVVLFLFCLFFLSRITKIEEQILQVFFFSDRLQHIWKTPPCVSLLIRLDCFVRSRLRNKCIFQVSKVTINIIHIAAGIYEVFQFNHFNYLFF